MENTVFASFDPADMKEGSNLFDNVDAKVVDARYSGEGPDNYTVQDGQMPLFAWLFFELAGTTPIEERTVSQSYSLGGSSREQFTVSDDGSGLIPNSAESQLRRDSKFGTLVGSFKSVGLPPAILKGGNIKGLIGLNGHWKRVADKERNFEGERQKQGMGATKSKFPPSTLCLIKVISLPGQVAKPVGAPSTTGVVVAAPATPVAGNGAAFDLDTLTMDSILDVMKEKGGKVQRSALTLLVSQKLMKDPTYAQYRQDVARRATDEAFLTALTDAGVLKYDGAAVPPMLYAA